MAETWNDVAQAVRTAAPQLANLLAGKDAGAQAAAAAVLAGVLGAQADPKGVLDKLNAAETVGAMAQLAQVESMISYVPPDSQEESVASLQLDRLKVLNEDAKSKTAKLAWWIVGAFAVMFLGICYLAHEKVDFEKYQSISLMLGALIAAFTTVIQYYFGSSAGSAQKTAILSQNAPAAPTPTPTPTPKTGS